MARALAVDQHVEKGNDDGLYISSVACCHELWALIMDAGTGFTAQARSPGARPPASPLGTVSSCSVWGVPDTARWDGVNGVAGAQPCEACKIAHYAAQLLPRSRLHVMCRHYFIMSNDGVVSHQVASSIFPCAQVYELSSMHFLPKDWIMERWEEGYYITAMAGSAGGSSLVVMSKGTPYTQQSYKVRPLMPFSGARLKAPDTVNCA